MRKQLTFVILAMVAVVLCSASTVSANPGLGVDIEPGTQHTSPGGMVEYTITVFNYDSADKYVSLDVDVWECKVSWFEWTWKDNVLVLGNSVSSVSMKVTPEDSTASGEYNWIIVATADGEAASAPAKLVVVQEYDYVSETTIEGEGVFTIDKKVRSSTGSGAEEQRFSVNVDKHFVCRGSIDGFVNNEYLIEDARGNTPNFKQESAVDNYRATASGDFLFGDERLRSSFVFGGTGAKIHETYDVQKMDARLESINLHSTGDQKHKTELDTINDFSGYFLIDAKQSIPGVKHIEDRQEFWGNWTVSKHLIFRRPDMPIFDCP